jgi:hypothetical protein
MVLYIQLKKNKKIDSGKGIKDASFSNHEVTSMATNKILFVPQ